MACAWTERSCSTSRFRNLCTISMTCFGFSIESSELQSSSGGHNCARPSANFSFFQATSARPVTSLIFWKLSSVVCERSTCSKVVFCRQFLIARAQSTAQKLCTFHAFHSFHSFDCALTKTCNDLQYPMYGFHVHEISIYKS